MLRNLSVLLVVILVIGGGLFFVTQEKTSPVVPSKQAGKFTHSLAPSLDAPTDFLSRDVSFPTPVIQLQQTVAHGLLEAERVDLPLLSGELAEFSQENISEEYPSPPELEDLKQRLKKLQSLSQ